MTPENERFGLLKDSKTDDKLLSSKRKGGEKLIRFEME